jgi:hypothetical protein
VQLVHSAVQAVAFAAVLHAIATPAEGPSALPHQHSLLLNRAGIAQLHTTNASPTDCAQASNAASATHSCQRVCLHWCSCHSLQDLPVQACRWCSSPCAESLAGKAGGQRWVERIGPSQEAHGRHSTSALHGFAALSRKSEAVPKTQNTNAYTHEGLFRTGLLRSQCEPHPARSPHICSRTIRQW